MLVAAPVLPTEVPSLEEYPFNVVGGRKVDVAQRIFGRRPVARSHRPGLGAQVHAPPDAHVFLRPDPRCVCDLRGFVEVEDQSRIDQVDGPAPDLHRPPRRDKFAAFADFHAVGPRSQFRFELIAVAQEGHLRKIVERGFVDAAVQVFRGAERERCVGVRNFCHGQFAVRQFVGLEVARYRPRHALSGEPESGSLIHDVQRIACGAVFVAEAHTVVEHPETERQLNARRIFQFDGHLVVAVAVEFVLAPGLSPGFVMRIAPDALHGETVRKVRLAGFHTECRREYNGLSVCRNRITGCALVVEVDFHGDVSVRRDCFGCRWCAGCEKECRQQETCQDAVVRCFHGSVGSDSVFEDKYSLLLPQTQIGA